MKRRSSLPSAFLFSPLLRQGLPPVLLLHTVRLVNLVLMGAIALTILIGLALHNVLPALFGLFFSLFISRTLWHIATTYIHWIEWEPSWRAVLNYVRVWDPLPFWFGLMAPFGIVLLGWFAYQWIVIPSALLSLSFLFQTLLFMMVVVGWAAVLPLQRLGSRLRRYLFPPSPQRELVVQFYRQLPFRNN